MGGCPTTQLPASIWGIARQQYHKPLLPRPPAKGTPDHQTRTLETGNGGSEPTELDRPG